MVEGCQSKARLITFSFCEDGRCCPMAGLADALTSRCLMLTCGYQKHHGSGLFRFTAGWTQAVQRPTADPSQRLLILQARNAKNQVTGSALVSWPAIDSAEHDKKPAGKTSIAQLPSSASSKGSRTGARRNLDWARLARHTKGLQAKTEEARSPACHHAVQS